MFAKQAKYRVIYHYRNKYPVSQMCKFFNVSRSGYYSWIMRLNRPDKDADISKIIIEGYEKSRRTYGYRRIRIWITRNYGFAVNHKRILRIMQNLNIRSIVRQRRNFIMYEDQLHRYDNLLARNFHAEKPNQKWVTDITYIKTKQGTLYLSVIKDLFDGYIVSHMMSSEMSRQLVLNTIRKAKAKEKVTNGLVLHSDQGLQYTSHAYYHLIKEYGIVPSMSRRGNCLDNACMENFFGHLKTECTRRTKIETFDQARDLINDYIHFFNFERIQLKTKLTPYEKRCQSA